MAYLTEAGLSIELVAFAANFVDLLDLSKDTPQEEVLYCYILD